MLFLLLPETETTNSHNLLPTLLMSTTLNAKKTSSSIRRDRRKNREVNSILWRLLFFSSRKNAHCLTRFQCKTQAIVPSSSETVRALLSHDEGQVFDSGRRCHCHPSCWNGYLISSWAGGGKAARRDANHITLSCTYMSKNIWSLIFYPKVLLWKEHGYKVVTWYYTATEKGNVQGSMFFCSVCVCLEIKCQSKPNCLYSLPKTSSTQLFHWLDWNRLISK